MKKIPNLFKRVGPHIIDEVNPECQWVADGEGIATRKYDGTCCVVKDGRLYIGKSGWRPVGDGPEDKWHREAFASSKALPNGTYELVGPRIRGNPEGYESHCLIRHADAPQVDAPRTFQELQRWLSTANIEGVVWHHPDGRMAKIRAIDFGHKRGLPPTTKKPT